jgi:SAM-dependent methyltransferase
LLIHLAWRLDRQREFAPAELPNGKTACDIGCGNGDILRRLKASGYDAIGVEPDPKARGVASEVCKIYDGTAEDLPSLDDFDIVLMSHVLEHCIDPLKAVENAKSLLSKNGTLVIEVPNNAALGFWWFKGRWPWTDIPRHLSFFTERSLRKLLNQLGLHVTKVVYTGYVRQFTPDWRDKIGGYWSGWPLFLVSSFARDGLKYDSIRLHARVGGD